MLRAAARAKPLARSRRGVLRCSAVSRVQTRAFEADDSEAAGVLLGARHAALRRAEPLFDPRFEDPAVARAEVEALLADGATGAVAVEGGEVTGYLLGRHRENQPGWGANLWVEAAGHAVRDAETVRDLFAEAAPSWVERGWDAHYAVVPAHDSALVDAWFRLGFGQSARPRHPRGADRAGRPPAHLVVRGPRRGDVRALAELDVALPDHQLLAPTFAAGEAFTVEEAMAEWEESFDSGEDDGYHHVVVEHDGRVVGAATACALVKSRGHPGLTRPPHAGFLGYASVFPDARGSVPVAPWRGDLDWMPRPASRGGQRLAGDEPAVVAGLDRARLPAVLLPAAPPHRPLTAGRRSPHRRVGRVGGVPAIRAVRPYRIRSHVEAAPRAIRPSIRKGPSLVSAADGQMPNHGRRPRHPRP